MSDEPGRPKEGSEQIALSNVHRGVSCGPGRAEGAGIQNEAHGGRGQEGLHPRGSESRGGAGKEVTWWGGSQPSNRAEGGAGSTPWMGCVQPQGWAPGGSELGHFRDSVWDERELIPGKEHAASQLSGCRGWRLVGIPQLPGSPS